MINCKDLSEKIKALADARDALAKAEGVLDGINKMGGHQQSLAITLGSQRIEITEINNYYMQKVKRGYDMIFLGAKKVADAEVDRRKAICQSIEEEIRQLTK